MTRSSTASKQPDEKRAENLLKRAIIWNNHVCMPLRPQDDSFLPELEHLRERGVTAVTLNVGYDALPWSETIKNIAHFRHWA